MIYLLINIINKMLLEGIIYKYEFLKNMSSNAEKLYNLISKDSRKFPVLTGAIRQAKEILKRKNNRELREIKTNFDKSGKKK